MKKNAETVKNTSFTFFTLLAIIMIILRINGITFINNTYAYIYLIVYTLISLKYISGTTKKSKWLGMFILIYVLSEFYSYTGSYKSYKSPNNKNTLTVEYINVFPHAAKLRIYKGTCIIFKKELLETPIAGSGDYKLFWEGDNSAIVTGTPVASFKISYENGSLDNHYKNMIKGNKIQLLSDERMLIKIK